MKEIKRSKKTTYSWKPIAGGEIKPEHIPALEEAAETRIAEMMDQGYTSGQLFDNIYMLDDDPEDGVEYQGWWEVSTT